MGKTLDRNRETVRMALEPWVVEAALERLGNERFTHSTEQRTIVRATRTPWKVQKIRMLVVGYCFGIRSERRLCDKPLSNCCPTLEPGTYCRYALAPYQQATRFLELDQP